MVKLLGAAIAGDAASSASNITAIQRCIRCSPLSRRYGVGVRVTVVRAGGALPCRATITWIVTCCNDAERNWQTAQSSFVVSITLRRKNVDPPCESIRWRSCRPSRLFDRRLYLSHKSGHQLRLRHAHCSSRHAVIEGSGRHIIGFVAGLCSRPITCTYHDPLAARSQPAGRPPDAWSCWSAQASAPIERVNACEPEPPSEYPFRATPIVSHAPLRRILDSR